MVQSAHDIITRVGKLFSRYFQNIHSMLKDTYEQLHHKWTSNKDAESSPLETHLKPTQTSTIKLFEKIVNGWKPLTIFTSRPILDAWIIS